MDEGGGVSSTSSPAKIDQLVNSIEAPKTSCGGGEGQSTHPSKCNHQLQRYCNQVGGHCDILKPQGTGYIYKPLCDAELRFYEEVNRARSSTTSSDNHYNNTEDDESTCNNPLHKIADFIPLYYGVGTVCVQTTTTDPPTSSPITSPSPPHHSLHSPPRAANYLILEDLLSGFRKPCILDIKLGRLQRTLGATPEKRRRQLEKSLKTTSNALGFRLCGMQCYNIKSDAIVYRDKYWGRKLRREKIGSALKEWFSNGQATHYDLIHLVYLKITTLIRVIRELGHYRFWSSSLLWFYDGANIDAEKRRQTLGVRLIDFANAVRLPNNAAPDLDMLMGLENLAKFLTTINMAGSSPSRVWKLNGTAGRRLEQRIARRWRRRRRLPITEATNSRGVEEGLQENAVMSEDDEYSSSDTSANPYLLGPSHYVTAHQWSRWQTATTFQFKSTKSVSASLDPTSGT